jgi:hypothetical protein
MPHWMKIFLLPATGNREPVTERSNSLDLNAGSGRKINFHLQKFLIKRLTTGFQLIILTFTWKDIFNEESLNGNEERDPRIRNREDASERHRILLRKLGRNIQ